MQDLSSNVSINVLNQNTVEILFSATYTELKYIPPLVSSGSGLIGVAYPYPEVENRFNIVYTDPTYVSTVNIVIPEYSILADSINTNFTDITASFTRTLPVVTYNLPSTANPIGFKTGLEIEVNITGGLVLGDSRLRLLVTTLGADTITPVPLTFKDNTEHLFFEDPDLHFVNSNPPNSFTERITLLPGPGLNSLGGTITLEIQSSDAIVTQTPSTNVYTIQSTPTPITIDNMIMDPAGSGAYMHPDLKIIVPDIRELVYPIYVVSDDCEPVFTLNNFNTEFSITPEGVVNKTPGTLPGDYALDITVTDSFGGNVSIILNVCVFEILSTDFFRANNIGLCIPEKAFHLILKIFCPCEEIKWFELAYSRVESIGQVAGLLLQAVNVLFDYTVNPDFDTTQADIETFGLAILTDQVEDYRMFFKDKFPSLVVDSRLDKKLDYFVNISFVTFRKILTFYIDPTRNREIFEINDTECLKFCLKVCQV